MKEIKIDKVIEELEIIIDAEQVTYNYDNPEWVIPVEILRSWIKDLEGMKNDL